MGVIVTGPGAAWRPLDCPPPPRCTAARYRPPPPLPRSRYGHGMSRHGHAGRSVVTRTETWGVRVRLRRVVVVPVGSTIGMCQYQREYRAIRGRGISLRPRVFSLRRRGVSAYGGGVYQPAEKGCISLQRRGVLAYHGVGAGARME
eukprot:3205436-Rhodomonas_salina.3